MSMYATYSVGTTRPLVTTQAVLTIETVTAIGNGTIKDIGSENEDEKGIVYDTSSKSAPGNVAPGSSGYANSVSDSGSFGTGAFTKTLTGLSGAQTYYVRAYRSEERRVGKECRCGWWA